MNLIKQNIITGCVNNDRKWPRVSKGNSSHKRIFDTSVTTWPKKRIHIFCLCNSWKCLEILKLGMGVERIWAVDRPCSAPSPGWHSHVQRHKSTRKSRSVKMPQVYTKMDCLRDWQSIQSLRKSGHKPCSEIISAKTTGDSLRRSWEHRQLGTRTVTALSAGYVLSPGCFQMSVCC